MRIASFDIGKKNFSFCIEVFNSNEISSIEFIDRNARYNENGTLTKEFSPILDKIYNGEIILLENNDLTLNCDDSTYLDTECFHNLNDLLDKYQDYWDEVDIFLIEKQMSFGKKYNTMALKLGQHCFSYFSIHYGRSKDIIEFPAYYKTIILGSEKELKKNKSGKISYKAIDKPKRKKWAINKAIEILTNRNDQIYLDIIKKSKKKDDLCDVICQLQAFKVLRFFDHVLRY